MRFSKLKAALCGWMALAFAGFSTSALAESAINMPKGVTTLSGEVYDLHMEIFWWCVGIAVVVFGAMIISIIFHRKSNNPEPAKFHHNTTVEVIWTVIPFLILILMAVPAAKTLLKMEDFRESDISIKVTALQWKWNYDYIEEGFDFYSTLDEKSNAIRQVNSGLDPNEHENYLLDVDKRVVIPTGKKVRLLLTSADVIHSWWVPGFAVKKDAIPGFINELWFNVEEGKEGVYRGQCTELCGRDHGFMPIVVEAVTQEEYAEWVNEQRIAAGLEPKTASEIKDVVDGDEALEEAAAADAREPIADSQSEAAVEEWTMDVAMQRGEAAYVTSCGACHQANGEGMPAAGFPALKGSAMVTDDVAAHIDIVLNGKAGTAMAAFGNLSDEDIAAIVTYERNAWGNNTGDLVTPSDIKAAR
ncbi:MAG: cytochrome c oxidase subunit II [Gammaproteobacteria bacterium]|nr:cytochrome c oxidase subunit II [Gammaproteobacteria bacterium]